MRECNLWLDNLSLEDLEEGDGRIPNEALYANAMASERKTRVECEEVVRSLLDGVQKNLRAERKAKRDVGKVVNRLIVDTVKEMRLRDQVGRIVGSLVKKTIQSCDRKEKEVLVRLQKERQHLARVEKVVASIVRKTVSGCARTLKEASRVAKKKGKAAAVFKPAAAPFKRERRTCNSVVGKLMKKASSNYKKFVKGWLKFLSTEMTMVNKRWAIIERANSGTASATMAPSGCSVMGLVEKVLTHRRSGQIGTTSKGFEFQCQVGNSCRWRSFDDLKMEGNLLKLHEYWTKELRANVA